ncbi:MAG: hypothetical protein CMH48_13715 [Muricauda sp.]|nr:hypothetical protein [Allomuricauda sp.]MBC31886.1 hypothetical protein [Allomuricauda sp.]|tara:strand:- start:3864 stop:4973 length:1110 start_codon:yes stop_codon:yes gene_type:complete
MRKLFLIISVVVIVAVALFVTYRRLKTVKTVTTINPLNIDDSTYFLKDVDFADGDYALYIKHKEHGEFVVTDKAVLKKNKNKLRLKKNWKNYLPGEGNRSYGVILFKDNTLIKRKQAGFFSTFEIGDLKKYAKPVKERMLRGTREVIEEEIAKINSSNDKFIISQPSLSDNFSEFNFRVFFPSVVLPVSREIDKNGYERLKTVNGIEYDEWLKKHENKFIQEWTRKIENCIHNVANGAGDFDVEILHSTSLDTYIQINGVDWGGELRDTNNVILTLKDYIFYNFQAIISTNHIDAEKLYSLNYNKCDSLFTTNKKELLDKLKQAVLKSNKPHLNVDKGEVRLSAYIDTLFKSKQIEQQEHYLNWLEVYN